MVQVGRHLKDDAAIQRPYVLVISFLKLSEEIFVRTVALGNSTQKQDLESYHRLIQETGICWRKQEVNVFQKYTMGIVLPQSAEAMVQV